MRRNIQRSGIQRRNRQERYAIKDWVDRLADIPAFIIGNAPSLNEHNLLLLEDYFTIGINRAFYLLDPTILLWQDIGLWNTEFHNLHNLQALKVARDIADPRRRYYNYHLKGGPYKFDKTKTHIMYGRGSSGPLACQLAVALGCRPIILLGCDCQKGSEGESDFYGNNPHHRPHTLDQCEQGLQFIKEQCPIEILSCGNTELWERSDLKEILKNIDPKHRRDRQSYVRQIIRTSA